MTVKVVTTSICLALETVLTTRLPLSTSTLAGITSPVVKALFGQISSTLEKQKIGLKGSIFKRLIKRKDRK